MYVFLHLHFPFAFFWRALCRNMLAATLVICFDCHSMCGSLSMSVCVCVFISGHIPSHPSTPTHTHRHNWTPTQPSGMRKNACTLHWSGTKKKNKENPEKNRKIRTWSTLCNAHETKKKIVNRANFQLLFGYGVLPRYEFPELTN